MDGAWPASAPATGCDRAPVLRGFDRGRDGGRARLQRRDGEKPDQSGPGETQDRSWPGGGLVAAEGYDVGAGAGRSSHPRTRPDPRRAPMNLTDLGAELQARAAEVPTAT